MPLPTLSETVMTSEAKKIIECSELSKCYRIYDDPKGRLKQAIRRGGKKYYREFWALRNISFQVNRGESLGVIGRNSDEVHFTTTMWNFNSTSGIIKTQGKIAALLERAVDLIPSSQD